MRIRVMETGAFLKDFLKGERGVSQNKDFFDPNNFFCYDAVNF